MELEIISMTPQERMYSYSQSSQIEAQTGCIGHLRGDFGAGQEFFTSWFDHRGEYKTDEFKAEFDEVVNSLREKDGLLFSRDSMTRYCRQRPEAQHDPLLPAAPGSRDGGQLLHRVRLQAENRPSHLYAPVQSQLWGL